MLYLKELITKETKVTQLATDSSISMEDKKEILGKRSVSLSRQEDHMKMMYKMNNTWYYFKKEAEKYDCPFYLLDELMGSYLALHQKINAVSYFIASVKQKENKRILGLASENFKKEGFEYYFGDYYKTKYQNSFKVKYNQICIENISNSNLKILCSKEEDIEKLRKQILEMLALDLFMLQKDRNSYNLQFQINKVSHEIDLAPLYDFSLCNSKIGVSGIRTINYILIITSCNISSLIKKYPYFSSCLSSFLEIGMKTPFEKICEYYHFNQDCAAYENALRYYQKKEENQRRDLGLYLKK